MSVEELLKTTIEQIRQSLAAGNVVGEPMVIDDKTLIPFTKILFGFGSGRGEGGEEKTRGLGEGGGGGGGVEPVAVVAVFKGIKGSEGVQVLSLQKPSPLAKAIGEAVGGLVETFRKGKQEGTESQEGEEE